MIQIPKYRNLVEVVVQLPYQIQTQTNYAIESNLFVTGTMLSTFISNSNWTPTTKVVSSPREKSQFLGKNFPSR